MKWLKIFEKIYHFFSGTKNILYDTKIIAPVKVGIPVVSIGNLSFGGVGKTPFVIFIAKEMSLETKVSVVCLSYKADLKKASKVDTNKPRAAEIFGDEACVLQKALPLVEVWSGPQKYETAQAATDSTFKPQLVIVDDGFSHRKLHRHFDILLIDATVGFETYLRESEKNLRRAHAVVITKVNLSEAGAPEKIVEKIKKMAPYLKNSIYVSSVKTILKIDKSDPLFVFCGLAKPQSLIKDLEMQGYKIAGRQFFEDHHRYDEMEQKRIWAQYSDLKNSNRGLRIVTTMKDFVKLTNPDLLSHASVADHVMIMDEITKEELIGKIRKHI